MSLAVEECWSRALPEEDGNASEGSTPTMGKDTSESTQVNSEPAMTAQGSKGSGAEVASITVLSSVPLPSTQPTPHSRHRLVNVTPPATAPSEPTSSPAFGYHSVLPTLPVAGQSGVGDEVVIDLQEIGTGSKKRKRKGIAVALQPVNGEEGPLKKKTRTVASKISKQTPITAQGAKPIPKAKPITSASRKLNTDDSSLSNEVTKGKGAVPLSQPEGSETEVVGALIPALPEGAPKYVENTLVLCLWVDGEKRWQQVVRAWLRFDEDAGFQPSSKELSRLPTSGRPKEVGTWVSHARSATFRPAVLLPRFANEFSEWWRAIQPKGREAVDGEFIRLTKPAKTDWTKLQVSGANGLVNIVGALAWWHKAVYDLPKDKEQGEAARNGHRNSSN